MNKAELIGRLTKAIELKHTHSGTPVCSFTLAVNGRKKQDGTKETDYITCTAFGAMAETLSKYTDKGHRISVTGRIRTGSYEKDGQTVYTTDVIVEDFDFLESRKTTETTDDDFPF